ncbi:hypothetical protein BGZ99_001814 [Dissophora globulifera]|uniref:F-box domain-containing protein n=1 Tax=Dissophora globulifera TaxID=979702 RepID=A0A9P6RNE8_9FUNG|nr:hypothetical protein BGZ99_001814 [Dissophora globulifera]
MSGQPRSTSISPYKEPPGSPSLSIPDEGYDEQRIDVPKWVHQWTDEQKAELAIQLLKSVSPSVFTRSYSRLTPLFEYRDFLVLLPYELTVHLLSFLDEKSLATVALVSKAWNKCASDNTVWKGLYLKRGWKVNQEMVDWYLNWADLEEQWLLGPKGMHPRVHFESESSRGKRKMLDHTMVGARGDFEEYGASEVHDNFGEAYGEQHVHDDDDNNNSRDTDNDALGDNLGCVSPHLSYFGRDSPYLHAEDVEMGSSPDEPGSSPISFPNSSPDEGDPSFSPELPEFDSIPSFLRSRSSPSTIRAPSTSQRSARFSLTNAAFMPSLHRPRLPMYNLGSNLMSPPSMLRRISHRASPPSPLRIPSFQNGNSPSIPASTSSRPSRFFSHQRSVSADQVRSTSPPTTPTTPTPVSPTAMGNLPNGPHSPLSSKSLWSVIRHGVMGVSGSTAWPSLHSHRHTDSSEGEQSSSRQHASQQHHHHHHHHHHHLGPSLPAWLMHLPSPLASASSRYQSRSSNTQQTSNIPNSPTSPIAPLAPTLSADPAIPRRIDYASSNAPLPSEVLSPDALHIHRHPITKRPMVNWMFMCKQRKLLEQNWNRGIHFAKELPGHTEGIYCIQFDDQKIISGSRDNTIKIWDLASGQCLRTYLGHTASVLCLQYDEERIVSGSSDTTIIVWDLESGATLQRLVGHTDSVLSLRFEKDIVVSCSKDRTVKIWNISTGERIRTLVGHRAAVNAVQFSPEASTSPISGSPRVVVSASGDKTIKIWSFETGECLRTLEGHSRGIACIQFEGNVIVSGSSDRSIKIWDIARGECVKTLVGHEGLVRTLQFSGSRIISGGYDETLKIWDKETGKLLADMDGRHSHRVFKLQFNDSKIVSCSQDQKIIIWDFAVGVDTTFLV